MIYGQNDVGQEVAQRIMARVSDKVMPITESGCFVWLGSCGNSGYGKARNGKNKDISLHRAAYIAAHGSIPKGVCVLHRCDVRSCLNPNHLFLGTKSDNSKDMVVKGRNFSAPRLRTKCPQGHPYNAINSNGARICTICNEATRARYLARRKNVK